MPASHFSSPSQLSTPHWTVFIDEPRTSSSMTIDSSDATPDAPTGHAWQRLSVTRDAHDKLGQCFGVFGLRGGPNPSRAKSALTVSKRHSTNQASVGDFISCCGTREGPPWPRLCGCQCSADVDTKRATTTDATSECTD